LLQYAAAMNVDFDALGISIVTAGGKAGLGTLYQLYDGLGFPVFLLFDNDIGGNATDIHLNRVLTRLLELLETDRPEPDVTPRYAVLEPDFEGTVRAEVGAEIYDELKAQAAAEFGAKAGKPIDGRFIARKLTERGIIPPTIRKVIEASQEMVTPIPAVLEFTEPGELDLDDEIPF